MTPLEIVARVGMGKRMRPMAELLARRFECWVSSDDLARVMYEDDADGGPDTPDSSLKVIFFHLKKKLKGTGLKVEGVSHWGRRMIHDPEHGKREEIESVNQPTVRARRRPSRAAENARAS